MHACIDRGIAEEDPSSPHNLHLLIPDYPYAVDGLSVWSAISSYVDEYTALYYPTDHSVLSDPELQSWWHDLVHLGHSDHQHQPWWPAMSTRHDLSLSCTTIIWIASAMHAAVNFGQYPFAGFLPNRPTASRRLMPVPNSKEYDELRNEPEKAMLRTITSQVQTIIGVSLIEILSKHASDEVYLGERGGEWAADGRVVEVYERFGRRLKEVEKRIGELNRDEGLKNRVGPAKVAYELLSPFSGGGITAKGIPNSISI